MPDQKTEIPWASIQELANYVEEKAERRAAKQPNHDWRITMFGPMHGETYQRQGPREWVLVEKNEGFA